METTVDWWARALGIAGVLFSLLALGLQYIRHRQERPKVALRVATTRGKMVHQLKCKLINSGGSDVSVARWLFESAVPDEVHVVNVTRGRLMGQAIPARGVLPFTIGIHVKHNDLDKVTYVLCVVLATGRPVTSRSLVLPVHEHPDRPPHVSL